MVHPFLDLPTPTVIAHRGASATAPENTLEAFQAAVDLGCRVLETDIHVTRDGVVVAFHDDRLDRQTDLRGEIEQLTIAEVERADAGYHFAGDDGSFPFRGRGVRVPRLEQILERFPDTRLVIDPKTDRGVAPLAALLDRFSAWDRVCVGSFSDRRLARIRQLGRGRACTSMGPAATATARLASALGRMPRLGADCLQVPIRQGPIPIVTERFVRAAHRARLPVQVWTVDDGPTMRRLLDIGVDAIITNRPKLALEIVRDHPAG
ncbi:MAG TPA: glycerophosphodiester phosphodiesterase [Solirubrobacter sp.]|nr:glycerophosphodiester phosphodiesterase [Solirubrobacter sp.]